MNNNIKNLVRASLFLAIAIIFQAIGRANPAVSQIIVGSVVNCVLILTTFICGTWWGIGVGALTPILAWFLQQLPGPMGPFVPFIAIGNAIYIILFGLLKNKSKWGKYTGYGIGSICKFLFLSFSASTLVSALKINIPSAVLNKLTIMMSTPQLITALIGGAIALIIIEALKKRKVI